ncbi:MAG: type IV toxin-antitoxin system AbiEi family antitoxin [Propionibacteriaceae bacterium]|nr:type IV toxin-antitoxin system AbiEi family antitoxin [Propionibacteriaceae bacterium]
MPVNHVPQRLAAPRRRGEWLTPASGLWVPVLAEYRMTPPVPAEQFIDAMMRHLDAGYYVGWLSAAGLWGASHQAAMATQVAVSRRIRARTVGGSRLVFRERSRLADIPVVRREGRWAGFWVSTSEATALDVADDMAFSGGLDNAVTVIAELAEEANLDMARVAALAALFPAAAARRVGWVVETFTDGARGLDELAAVAAGASASPSRLSPYHADSGPLDQRWMLRLNADPDRE